MMITGVVLKCRLVSFGIGTDVLVENKSTINSGAIQPWALYGVDLSSKGKYTGYIIDSKGVTHHVISGFPLDGKIHLNIRKVRSDYGKKRMPMLNSNTSFC